MREIKFRGKTIEDGTGIGNRWVYGFLKITPKDQPYITQWDDSHGWNSYKCEKGSEGQYTGLKDKNGVEIYDKDILFVKSSFPKDIPDKKVMVNIGITETWVENGDSQSHCWRINGDTSLYRYEVIGNLHENPDLLKKETNEPPN